MRLFHLLAEAKAPRYTSYPTAPHFTATVTRDTYADWLRTLAPDARLSLYLHVPYCRTLCHYCGCHTKAAQRTAPVARYAQSLRRELALVAPYAGSRRVLRLHWGGGTPSILGATDLVATWRALGSQFDLSEVEEHAIELDPRAVDAKLVATLAFIRINRASLGIQDLTPHVQAAIGRAQPAPIVERAVHLLRDAGIYAINFDLMYGLPKQTVADIHQNIDFVAAILPPRIALFGYAHVPWFKSHQRLIDAADLPGAAERLLQAETAREALVRLGYVPIGLDHFALPGDALARAARTGRLRRNFQGYTDDQADAWLGFGASAIGRLPQGYAQNARDIHAYQRAIDGGLLPTEKGLRLSDDDRVRGAVIERLMCDLTVDLDATAGPRAAALRARLDERLVELFGPDAGLVVGRAGNRIEVTEHGRPFLRLIASALDEHLPRAIARHSAAV
jgi:oxygen-independent coproporphyrinogen-3 oxidase